MRWRNDDLQRFVRVIDKPSILPTGPIPVREPRIGPPNATWRELKQLAWGVVLVVPYIAIVCYGAAGLVGARAAFWIAVGLVCLTIVTFSMLVLFSLVVTGIDDRAQARLHRRVHKTRRDAQAGH